MTGLAGDLAAAFARYERALMAGDIAAQQESFWAGPGVVRVDGDGPLVGPAALAEFRARRPTPGPRRLRDLHVVHSPGDTVVTVSVNERLGPGGDVIGLGTQTQVWARTGDGWRVIAACVSPITAPPTTGPPTTGPPTTGPPTTGPPTTGPPTTGPPTTGPPTTGPPTTGP